MSRQSVDSSRLAVEPRSRFRSARTRNFTESVIREMTRLALRHNAVNLAQGFPDFPAPEAVKQAAKRAIDEEHNQYTITWGTPALRQAISAYYGQRYGLPVDPEREITVCCGATEGMIASLRAGSLSQPALRPAGAVEPPKTLRGPGRTV